MWKEKRLHTSNSHFETPPVILFYYHCNYLFQFNRFLWRPEHESTQTEVRISHGRCSSVTQEKGLLLALFDQKYSKNNNNLKISQLKNSCILMFKCIRFIPVMQSWIFQQPLLQSSVSHVPSDMMIWCSINISYYYYHQCWKYCTA